MEMKKLHRGIGQFGTISYWRLRILLTASRNVRPQAMDLDRHMSCVDHGCIHVDGRFADDEYRSPVKTKEYSALQPYQDTKADREPLCRGM